MTSRNQSTRRRGMPNHQALVKYWAPMFMRTGRIDDPEDLLESRYGLDDPSLRAKCFACGDIMVTERAHILAVSSGGANTADNLHVLCQACHTISEPLAGAAYWRWFDTTTMKSHMAYHAPRRAAIRLGIPFDGRPLEDVALDIWLNG